MTHYTGYGARMGLPNYLIDPGNATPITSVTSIADPATFAGAVNNAITKMRTQINTQSQYGFQSFSLKNDFESLTRDMGTILLHLLPNELHYLNRDVFPTFITEDVRFKSRTITFLGDLPTQNPELGTNRSIERVSRESNTQLIRWGMHFKVCKDAERLPQGAMDIQLNLMFIAAMHCKRLAILAVNALCAPEIIETSTVRAMNNLVQYNNFMVESRDNFAYLYKNPGGLLGYLDRFAEILRERCQGQVDVTVVFPHDKLTQIRGNRYFNSNLVARSNLDTASNPSEPDLVLTDGTKLVSAPKLPDEYDDYSTLNSEVVIGNFARFFKYADMDFSVPDKIGWTIYDGRLDNFKLVTAVQCIKAIPFLEYGSDGSVTMNYRTLDGLFQRHAFNIADDMKPFHYVEGNEAKRMFPPIDIYKRYINTAIEQLSVGKSNDGSAAEKNAADKESATNIGKSIAMDFLNSYGSNANKNLFTCIYAILTAMNTNDAATALAADGIAAAAGYNASILKRMREGGDQFKIACIEGFLGAFYSKNTTLFSVESTRLQSEYMQETATIFTDMGRPPGGARSTLDLCTPRFYRWRSVSEFMDDVDLVGIRPLERLRMQRIAMVAQGVGVSAMSRPMLTQGEDATNQSVIFNSTAWYGVHVMHPERIITIENALYDGAMGGSNTAIIDDQTREELIQTNFEIVDDSQPSMYIIALPKDSFPDNETFEIRGRNQLINTKALEYHGCDFWATYYGWNAASPYYMNGNFTGNIATTCFPTTLSYATKGGHVKVVGQTHHGAHGEQPGSKRIRRRGEVFNIYAGVTA